MKALVAIVRTIIAMTFFAITVSSLILFSVLTFRRWSLRISGPALRFLGRTVLRILGIKLTLKDPWPFEEDEARVVIINHQSTLDIIWFCAICPNRPSAVGKRELIWIPFINLGWWAFRLFLIDRSNREVAIQTMKAATENTIQYRRSVSLAPEGTRSKDARILPFKKGVFHLAMEGKLPIYPVVMCGAAEAMPKHTFWAYPRPITIRFLPPISTEEWTRETLDGEIEAIRAQMVSTYEALREEEGLPPL